jgi:pimeloyl-ACP methyl ester carboxylesterase
MPAADLTPRLDEVMAMGPHGLIRIAYVEWGPADSQHVVVCVHGLTRNARDFDFLARRLAQKGVRVIAADLPGRGRSQWLTPPSDYQTPAYLAAMAAVIARSGAAEVDWIGTSLGGHIGMEMAAMPGNQIRRLILNDFGARISGVALQRIGSYLRNNRRFASIEDVDLHLRSIHETFGALTDSHWRHMAEHSSVKTEEGDYRQHFDPAIGRVFSWPLMVDVALWNVWEKVACPVLILHGEDSDLLHASTVRDMQRRGAAAKKKLVRAIVVRECGHAPSLMTDSQMALIEDFLEPGRPAAKVVRIGGSK